MLRTDLELAFIYCYEKLYLMFLFTFTRPLCDYDRRCKTALNWRRFMEAILCFPFFQPRFNLVKLLQGNLQVYPLF